jgi:hypothetical protein
MPGTTSRIAAHGLTNKRSATSPRQRGVNALRQEAGLLGLNDLHCLLNTVRADDCRGDTGIPRDHVLDDLGNIRWGQRSRIILDIIQRLGYAKLAVTSAARQQCVSSWLISLRHVICAHSARQTTCLNVGNIFSASAGEMFNPPSSFGQPVVMFPTIAAIDAFVQEAAAQNPLSQASTPGTTELAVPAARKPRSPAG